jgi:hypothetical protein
VGLVLCLSRLLQGLGAHDWYTALRTWGSDVTRSHPFYNGLTMILVGAALALSARRLTHWIIVLPSTGCPRCGHARSPGAQDTRCPECGLDWPRT